MRRMPPADHRQIPTQSHRLPLARRVCAVRGVRGRAAELLLSAGLQTLLQAGLCGVSAHLCHHFFSRGHENCCRKNQWQAEEQQEKKNK